MALIGLSHYIWDEPLNDADIYTRMQLEELLLTHRPTMSLWSTTRLSPTRWPPK